MTLKYGSYFFNIPDVGVELLKQKIVYDANGNPEYIGLAKPGTATSAAGWLIKKFVYDANQNVTDVLFASGEVAFDKIMDNYASYSYS